MSVDGGGSRDLAILNVRKGGFAKGSTITVDQGRGALRTRARAGRVRSLEVMAIFDPTIALVKVDFPAFGRPTKQANPARYGS